MKIYLAGPDVFRRNPEATFNKHKAFAIPFGGTGLSPFDSEAKEESTATDIFKANVKLINECDLVIANLEPFRGPNVDDGTAWEIGYAYGLGKKIYGYLPMPKRSLLATTHIYKLLYEYKPETAKSMAFPHIEDFDYSRNLMIVDSIRETGGDLFGTFIECLEHHTGKTWDEVTGIKKEVKSKR